MPYELKLAQFSGPLDLLLQLIEREELSINEISLNYVADAYLSYVSELDATRADELADFLVIAARLLLIKSRTLLPQLAEEQTEGMSLADQLKMYKEFVRAAEKIHGILKQKHASFFRPFVWQEDASGFYPPQGVTADAMRETIAGVLDRLRPVAELPKTSLARAVSIAERIRHLQDLLERSGRVHFGHFIDAARDRVDVVVSFLALLELIKQRAIRVGQTELFEDIIIERYESTSTM